MIALLPAVLAFQIASAPVRAAGLVIVLLQTYPADPASAIPTAQQLAAMDDEIAQGAFDDWIQKTVARDFAPLMNARAKSESADAFLRAMAEPSTNGLTGDATAGLRMWADAQTTSDVQRLSLLAATEFTAPASLGARYQLLLADLLERRPEGDLAAAGRGVDAHGRGRNTNRTPPAPRQRVRR